MNISLKKIILDPSIQSRVAISQGTVDDYSQAYIDGAKLPPVVVFQEGSKYYLADGWHRFKANKLAGYLDIEAEVIQGTLRDAIKYSLSANATHGLNRTNADKRKAVLTALADPEWAELSAAKIAQLCAVSHTFVNNLYKEQTAIKSRETDRTTGNVSGDAPQPIEKVEYETQENETVATPRETFDAPGEVAKVEDGVFVIPAGMTLVAQEAHEEMAENYKSTLEDYESLSKVMEDDDQLSAAKKEIEKLGARARAAESRINGLLREKNEAVRLVRARDKTIESLKKQLKDLGVAGF